MSTINAVMRYFQYDHLPEGPLRQTSKMFSELAHALEANLPHAHALEVSLDRLLEAKDAAVRSALDLPSGTSRVVSVFYTSEEPPREALEAGDVWLAPGSFGVKKIWNVMTQDWDEETIIASAGA